MSLYPKILEPLFDGAEELRVTNQVKGGTITLLVRSKDKAPEEELGTRSSSEHPEIPVPKLIAGQILRAMQELCGVKEFSDPVTVQSRPAVIGAPTVRPPLYACSAVVSVDNVIPGATVYLLQSAPNDFTTKYPIGQARSSGTSVVVTVFPTLLGNAYVAAYQVVGGQPSPMSKRVRVGVLESLPTPNVPSPVVIGSKSVWVTGIVPGAYVRLFDRGVQIGGGSAAGSQASISTYWPIPDGAVIRAKQLLCQTESQASAPRPAVPKKYCAGAPKYEPDLWTGNGTKKQCCNNCYNYACDIRTDNFADPGFSQGYTFGGSGFFQCEDVIKGALLDRLKRCTQKCHPCHHKVALFRGTVSVKTGGQSFELFNDYHWYRQDKDGMWSLEPLPSPAGDSASHY